MRPFVDTAEPRIAGRSEQIIGDWMAQPRQGFPDREVPGRRAGELLLMQDLELTDGERQILDDASK